MRDGEHAIYITLNHFGPLPRDLVFQLLDQGKGHFDKKYLETCLDFLKEDGIVSIGEAPESILTLRKVRHKGKWENFNSKNYTISSTREKESLSDDTELSEEEKYIADLLKKPYSRMFVYDEDTESYGAAILEFTGCVSMGATVEEANKNLDEAAEGWVLASLDMGNTINAIPEPRGNDDHNGRILLRVPRYIHAKAVRYAALENTSLNQFILSALCLQLGETVKKKKKGNSKESTHYRMDVNCDYEYGRTGCFKCKTKSITVYMQRNGTTWCRDCIEKENEMTNIKTVWVGIRDVGLAKDLVVQEQKPANTDGKTWKQVTVRSHDTTADNPLKEAVDLSNGCKDDLDKMRVAALKEKIEAEEATEEEMIEYVKKSIRVRMKNSLKPPTSEDIMVSNRKWVEKETK